MAAPATEHFLPISTWPVGLWRALVAVWCLFWLLLIVVAVADNWDEPHVLWWQPLLWEGSSAVVGTALTALMFAYGARQQALLATPLRWFWQHLKWLPLVSVLFVVFAYGLRHGVYALLGRHYPHEPWLQVWLYETVKLGLFLGLWLGVIFGAHSFLAWRDQQQRLHAMQQALTDAKLQQLKAQLQPHFLFNTLNTISAFMQTDVDRADRLLSQLADLLRASLTMSERDTVPLSEELQLLRLYAAIMTERFAPRVQIDWHVAADTLAVPVPTLLLQPLLENAFKHGVEQTTEPTRISITSHGDGGYLQLIVSNTRGASAAAPAFSTGVGLSNCRERLHAIYGDRATLSQHQFPDRFEVVVRLPGVAT